MAPCCSTTSASDHPDQVGPYLERMGPRHRHRGGRGLRGGRGGLTDDASKSAQTRLDAAAQWGVLMVLFLVPAVVPAQTMRWPEAVAAAGGGAHAGRDLRAAAQTPCGRQYGRPQPRRARLCRRQGGHGRGHRGVDRRAGGARHPARPAGRGGAAHPRGPGARGLLPAGHGPRPGRPRHPRPPRPAARRRAAAAAGGGPRVVHVGRRTQDRLLRQTIQTQLEATTWTPFADLTP